MNFSDITSFSGQAEFSPNTEYLAVVKGIKVTVYESSSMGIICTWNILDQVSKLEWAQDSTLLLCSQAKRGLVQIFNIKDVKWECKISLGPCGLSSAWFCPDSRHIITICHFQIRLNIWSLLQKEVFALTSPKFSNKGVTFSKCKQFIAILKRQNGRDSIVVVDNFFNVVSTFATKNNDIEDIEWTHDNFYIVATGISSWLVYSPAGELIYEYGAMNIDKCYNSVNGCYSAITHYDNILKVFHHITWTQLAEFRHELNPTGKDLTIYNEIETLEKDGLSYSYEMLDGPLKLLPIEGERKVSIAKWCYSERFLACKFGNIYLDITPQVVYIWDTILLTLKAVLIHKHTVKAIEWCPGSTICAIATGNNRIYLWTEDGASLCDLPFGIIYLEREITVNKLGWSASGMHLLAKEKGNFVVAYPQIDEISK